MSNDKNAHKSAIGRIVALTLIIIALFLAMRFLPVQQRLMNFNDWVSQIGVAGIFIFVVVYAVATVLLAPGSILTIGAGFAFGLWKGFLAVSAGATIGVCLRDNRQLNGWKPGAHLLGRGSQQALEGAAGSPLVAVLSGQDQNFQRRARVAALKAEDRSVLL